MLVPELKRQFIVVGRDRFIPTLALGPFATREQADEMMAALVATTSGKYHVLPLHTPNPRSNR